MFTRSRHAIAAIILGAAAVSLAAPADALPILRITASGGGSVTVTDNGAGDLNANAGVVLFNGVVGNWTLNVTTGTTKPFIGSAQLPRLDLNSVNASTLLASSETLTIEFSENGFTSAPSSSVAGIGGATDGTVNYSVWASASNTTLTQSTLLTQLGPLGTGAFSATAGTILGVTAPFSLTQVVTVTHGAGTKISSFNADYQVPEPGTLAILGFGLLGLGFVRRRQLRKAA